MEKCGEEEEKGNGGNPTPSSDRHTLSGGGTCSPPVENKRLWKRRKIEENQGGGSRDCVVFHRSSFSSLHRKKGMVEKEKFDGSLHRGRESCRWVFYRFSTGVEKVVENCGEPVERETIKALRDPF